jgi:hypothetical protein
MIIENLRSERQHDRARVAATVRWEDCDRPTQEIYFETQEEFADDLTCNPHAFLVGCVIPAFHHGEKRIFIEEEICPELREGLMTVMHLLRHWYYKLSRSLVRIEAEIRSNFANKHGRAAAFFSGGVDGWATLHHNKLNVPPAHPSFIKDVLVVFGLFREESDDFKKVLSLMVDTARMAGVVPVPVHTNLVSLGQGWEFWGDEGEGAVFAAIAHAFAQRFSVVSLASSFDIPLLHPHGSHPILDPAYSSSDLRIKHDGVCLSRLMKVKLIAEWDVALQNLRVCNNISSIGPNNLNCGQCEKCVRTMLALLIVDALHRTQRFSKHDVTPDLVESAIYMDKTTSPFYRELILPLMAMGRHDLVAAIRRKLSQYRRLENRHRVKAHIRKLDTEYLRGALVKTLQRISPHGFGE